MYRLPVSSPRVRHEDIIPRCIRGELRTADLTRKGHRFQRRGKWSAKRERGGVTIPARAACPERARENSRGRAKRRPRCPPPFSSQALNGRTKDLSSSSFLALSGLKRIGPALFPGGCAPGYFLTALWA
jgi:hypothetical protein